MAKSPPLVIANCIQVKLGTSISGRGAWNVLHFRKAGSATIDQTTAESVGAAAKTAWTAHMASLCPANVGLMRVSVRDLSQPNQAEFVDSGAAVLGTDSASQPLPAHVSLCLTLRTELAGKSFRGRVYLAGFSETQNDAASNIAPGAAAGAVAFLDAFSTAMGSLGFILGVASRPANATQIIKRTGYPDGSQEEEILSSSTQKAGGIEDVTTIQSRNSTWESQRKRINNRGGDATVLTAVASASRPRH